MQATIDLYRSQGERDLEDAVIAMSKNSEQLAAFAHELRVQDQDDKYTKDFLYGQVKPDLLVTIILSNKWHKKEKRMFLKNNNAFRMVVGRKYEL